MFTNKGFTLIEVLVGTAIFVTVAIAAYGAFASLFQLVSANQSRIIAVELADEQFEIIRNMPYSNIGIVNGIPNGTLPASQNVIRGGITFNVGYTIRDVDLPFDGTFGSTTNNDLSPADNKFVQIAVNCATCESFQPVVIAGEIAPRNLENTSTNGALFVSAIDASGNPVSGAAVHISYATTSPIVIDDTTNNSGVLQVVDVPPAVKAYNISVTKAGYSTDQTYPVSGGNPNPVKQPATVASQQLTQASFAIDKLSALNIQSMTNTCSAVPNFHFNLTGSKQIGANVPKYSQALTTGGSGALNLGSMEWDSYTVAPTDSAYDLIGINPLNPIALSPNSSQGAQLIVAPKNPNSLMITVKDSATKLPLSGATVEAIGPIGYDQIVITGQGYINQADWSAGSGQQFFNNPSKYWSDDGNIDNSTSSGNIVLKQAFGSYNPSGVLESSTFDTGTTSNFYTLSWNPGSQPPAAGANSVRLQFATSPSSTPTVWNFLGPDGTSGTYYNTPNSTISSANNAAEYARYRAYLSTQTSTTTPRVSSIFFTYTSGCVPPGQVVFSGLASGTYTVNVSKSGYTSYSGTVNVSSGWQEQQVLLGP